MLDPFILKALIAGIGIALMAGPLGCFIAWQRMAYFGDAIAHASILGIVFALSFDVNFSLGIVAVALAITLGIYFVEKEKKLASDTLLGIAANGALALGLVIVSLSPSVSVDINALLFGDILAVDATDIAIIYGISILVCGALVVSWRNLMRLTLYGDIAKVEGVPIEKLRLLLMIAISVTVAVSIKIVGILLITSMLIIPAASARYFSRSPTQMAIMASIAGALAVCGGLYASLHFDTPTGPSIILAALGIFFLSYISNRIHKVS